MITDEDAKSLVAELRTLSAKHEVTVVSDAYTPGRHDGRYEAYLQGQHDGRKGACVLAAHRVEQNNHEESTMKFLLQQASKDFRQEIVEITTLEQLLELAGAEGRRGTWHAGVIVSEIIVPYEEFPDIEWELMIYDDYLE